MKITVLHLYHDFMNLYGESGNIRVFCRHLRDQGFEVELIKTTLGDTPDFSRADFIYMGCGTERNELLALKDLKQHGEAFGDALERKTTALFTGNAFHLIGESITDAAGTRHEGLGIYPFQTVETDKRRYINDALARCDLFDAPVVGFINKCTEVSGIGFPLLQMEMGGGNAPGDRREGIHFSSFYGTQLVGPVLVKNPAFLRHLILEVCGKTEGFQYRDIPYPSAENAYDRTLLSLRARLASGDGERVPH